MYASYTFEMWWDYQETHFYTFTAESAGEDIFFLKIGVCMLAKLKAKGGLSHARCARGHHSAEMKDVLSIATNSCR